MKLEDFRNRRFMRELFLANEELEEDEGINIIIEDLEIVYDDDLVYTTRAILFIPLSDFFSDDEIEMLNSDLFKEKTKGIEDSDELLDMLEDLVG
ncbi:MAG: hypothetical protein RBR50_01040 [Candidatus Izemoplasmatales bacterium]|nr:hypothetical protein [Candidatus Izemoplasmatales bacterium]